MRSKRALVNMGMSLMLELLTLVSGMILPRLFISTYGSEAYGLTNSITQFLGYLTLLQSGVGGVVRAALYKPLAENDRDKLSGIVLATEAFFRKLAYFTIAYTVILIVFFGCKGYQWSALYTASMVVIIALGSLLQYYFGITSQMVLQADQKEYIYSLTQLICVLVNTIIVVVLINGGASIHIVKLLSVLVFGTRPIILNIYVKKKYRINRKVAKDNTAISQRWDGIGQTIAYFVHNKTDIFLITLFMSLSYVSVYSVYAMVITALTTLISAFTNALQAAFGNMIAKKEDAVLQKNFNASLTLSSTLTTILFSTAIVLIIPFERLYTKGFEAETLYIQPLFAIIIIVAEAFYCYRLPYHTIIVSAGHYRQTMRGAYIEAILNFSISLVAIQFFGLVGVAIGTLVAMIYRTLDYVLYLRTAIVNIHFVEFARRMLVSILCITIAIVASVLLDDWIPGNYYVWVFVAIICTLVFTGLSTLGFYIVCKKDFRIINSVLKTVIRRK